MKKYICLIAGVALLAACEQKETTVTPPADTKEINTTVVNPSPAKSDKTETNTTINNTTTTTSPSP